MNRRTLMKGVLFILFLVGVYSLFRYTDLNGVLTRENIEMFVGSFGVFAPFAYMLFYAVAVSLLAPGTPITAVGAVLFGTLWGTTFTLFGATLGAASAFFIARTLGRDFSQSLFGERIRRWDKKIEEHGFSTIFYLRLIFFPFNALNFGAGLTRVRFRDYILGTFLGIIPGTFIITFFVDSVADAFFENGLLSREFLVSLVSLRVLTALALFALSFFIPKCIRTVAAKCGRKDLVKV